VRPVKARVRVHLVRLAAVAALVCAAAPARAQADKAGAEALLTDGLELVATHDYASACPKLEESLKLYPSLNTEYHLADCYELLGRTATAWVDFLEVADKAHGARETAKETKARERAAALEGKVGRLVIEIADASLAGLKVERDGIDLGKAQWGLPMPVDPGEHVVTASAPGRTSLTLKVTTGSDGGRSTLTVPSLEVAAAPPPVLPSPSLQLSQPPAPSPTGSSTTGDGQRLAGWVLGGVGVAGLAAGVVVGLAAKASYDGATGCAGTVCQTSSGLAQRDSARSTGNVATVVFIGGGALVATGMVVWLSAPRAPSQGPSVGVSPSPGGLVVQGSF
jgi:hypothetical protein